MMQNIQCRNPRSEKSHICTIQCTLKPQQERRAKLYGSKLQELSHDTKLKCDVFLPPLQVHVHRRGNDNLLKIIPAKILPKEYGGQAASLLDHWGKDLNVLSVPSPHSDRPCSFIFRLYFTFLSPLSNPFPFSST